MIRQPQDNRAERERAKQQRAEQRRQLQARAEREGVLSCMALVACADGRPSSAEADYASTFFTARERLADTETTITAGQLSSVSYVANVSRIRAYVSACAPTLTERRRLLETLLDLAESDSPITPDEDATVAEVADLLLLTAEKYRRLRQRWEAARTTIERLSRKGGTAVTSSVYTGPSAPAWCYRLLRCSETDSNESIKRAYLHLARKLHPDKHAASDDTQEETARHVKRFQRLQEAYDAVCDARKEF